MTKGKPWRRRKHNNSERLSNPMELDKDPDGSARPKFKILKRELGPEESKLDSAVWSRGLPDDVYCTILAHLPLSSFYKLRTVCKSWSLMASDKIFLEACSRVGSRAPSLLLMDKDCCWTYEPAMNEWKSIPLSFFLPHDSDTPTCLVSSAGGRILLLRRPRLLLHNPLNNSLRLLPPMFDMDYSDLPTYFDINVTGMYVNYDQGEEVSILVMNKTTNVDEDLDDDYDNSEPIISQIYDSRADSWKMLVDFNPYSRLSIESATMANTKLQCVISSYSHRRRYSGLAMYSVQSDAWQREKIRMPNEGQRLVAPHLFTYEGTLMMVGALCTDESRTERFPIWENVTVWELSASSNSRGADGYWNRVMAIAPEELMVELWNTSLDSFFFLSGEGFIYFGSRSGSSLGMINLKSQTWRLLPSFPGITAHFGGSIKNLQTFLYDPKFDLVL